MRAKLAIPAQYHDHANLEIVIDILKLMLTTPLHTWLAPVNLLMSMLVLTRLGAMLYSCLSIRPSRLPRPLSSLLSAPM